MAFVVELSFLRAGLISSHSDGLLLANIGVLALIANEAPMEVARQAADAIRPFLIFDFIYFVFVAPVF